MRMGEIGSKEEIPRREWRQQHSRHNPVFLDFHFFLHHPALLLCVYAVVTVNSRNSEIMIVIDNFAQYFYFRIPQHIS